MNGNSILLDTNILLYLLNGDETLVSLLEDNKLYISFITQLELLGFKSLTAEELRKVKSLISECIVVDINETIKEITIKLRRETGIKLPDCIIIATSVYLNIPLITADKEFSRAKEIDLILYNS